LKALAFTEPETEAAFRQHGAARETQNAKCKAQMQRSMAMRCALPSNRKTGSLKYQLYI
jgi:hypothetical protein